MNSSEPLLTVKQIARELGYCTDTVRRLHKAGKLPGAFQPGGKGSQLKMPVSAVKKLKGEG